MVLNFTIESCRTKHFDYSKGYATIVWFLSENDFKVGTRQHNKFFTKRTRQTNRPEKKISYTTICIV